MKRTYCWDSYSLQDLEAGSPYLRIRVLYAEMTRQFQRLGDAIREVSRTIEDDWWAMAAAIEVDGNGYIVEGTI